MKTLTLSAHSLDVASCPCRYRYYRLLGRAPAGRSAALTQGIAGHAALARGLRGEPAGKQDEAIARAFADAPPTPDKDGRPDYRTPAYLKEALAQYRAEFPIADWDIEEVEKPFDEVLWSGDTRRGPLELHWTGRRDLVAVSKQDGHRYVHDNKFTSQDRSVDYAVAKNSGAFKGYVWSYEKASGQPVHGVILRRTVIRKPTKDKPLNFSFPLDPPIYFAPERIAEWRENVIRRAVALFERNPDDERDWPQNETCCRGPYSACDYLDVCLLPPGRDRAIKLASDQFRDASERVDYDKDENE